MCAVVEALVIGLLPAILGGGLGTALSHAIGSGSSSRAGTGFLAWQACGLALAACLPTTRPRGRRRSTTRRALFGTGIAIRVLVVTLALAAMFGIVRGVRTDWDLGIAGFFVIPLLVVVGVIVTGAASRWIVGGLGRIRSCRALGAIAARYRVPGTVRLVIVASVTVATVAAILGASVEARPETKRLLAERLAHLPVLPGNVALLRLDATGLAALEPSSSRAFIPSELKQLRAAISEVVPHAQTIELRHVGAVASAFFCDECTNGPVIVADPRLRSIYGGNAEFPAPGQVALKLLTPGPKQLQASSLTRVRPREVLALDLHDGKPLPAATFAGAAYYEIPQSTVDELHLRPDIRSVFIQAPRPLTPLQSARLTAIARAWRAAPNTQLTLIGPSGQLQPAPALPTPVAASDASLRHAAWAATSDASRWSLAAVASLIALVTLLVALAIDTIDRRRDVQRLERVGATPRQVRGAAALYAAVLLGVVTWLDVVLVVGLTRVGIQSFNHAKPAIAVPFTVPVPLILLLTIGLPAVGAGVAALIARPTWLERRPI